MRCFEVEVNGERYCLAGVGDVGALSAFVTYVGVRGPDGADGSRADLSLRVRILRGGG